MINVSLPKVERESHEYQSKIAKKNNLPQKDMIIANYTYKSPGNNTSLLKQKRNHKDLSLEMNLKEEDSKEKQSKK